LFAAPEIQHKSQCSTASDMFSFGMLMVAVFNSGNSLIQAGHSTNAYFKQAGTVRHKFRIFKAFLLYSIFIHRDCFQTLFVS
jgi:hypothetical protein